ncbi:hypothetical protein [Arthrobacter mobilis]|uniref:hypothetical protein n=1 Tax=Arthrobacter mobilis TaxID=2724944 RepID=UPI001FE3D6EF|nr:hypothetical protein [Arthrobacter mobilis]
MRMAAGAAFDKHGNPKPGLANAILKALEVQRPLVLANLNRYRRKYPDAGPAELAGRLERDYLAAVTAGGATVGAFAIVPGIGTLATLGLSAAATVGFLEATALYAQSVAELHGIPTAEPERAQAMVMAIIMGDEGGALIKEFAGQRGAAPGLNWGNLVGQSMPSGLVGSLVRSLRKRFLKRLLAKQGTALLGRAVPFGIGAVVGGAGNHAMGRRVIENTREAFGELPLVLPMELVEDLARTKYRLPGRFPLPLPGAGRARRAAVQQALEEQERTRLHPPGSGSPESGGDGA